MLEEFYSYGQFTFKRDEVLWALRNADLFREGVWPPEPKNTGYTDPGIRRKGVKKEPAFVKPEIIIGEIDWRLERTGVDGKLLLAEVDAGYERFSDEAWTALNFISGWKRKEDTYVLWKAKRKYRAKGGVMRFRRQDLTRIEIQERAKRRRNGRR